MRDQIKSAGQYISTESDGYVQTRIGLVRKRAALAMELQALQAEMASKVDAIRALEATIRIFDPDVEIEGLPVRRLPAIYAAAKGEGARFLLDQLRCAPDGMTTIELTMTVMSKRELDHTDMRAVRLIRKRTGHALHSLRERGHLRSEKADASGMLRWWMF